MTHPIAQWRRARGIAQWRLAAAIEVSPELVTAVERGLRSADGLVRRMKAAGLVSEAEAQGLAEESRAWLAERRARVREEVFAACGR